MNTVFIPPGPSGYGKGLWLPVGSGKKVLSLTGREIHPVAIEIGSLTESEIVNGFSDIPPDNDILCVVINCAGSLRCGLYPQKGIPTINVLPTWRAGPLAQFITEDNYVSGVTMEQLVLVDTAEAPDSEPEITSEPAPRVITTPPPPRGAEKLVRIVEQTGTAVGHVIALLFAINVQVGCDFVPVGLSMQEAKPETIAKGVPAFLLSRQLTGPLAVIIGWLFSLGLF